MIKNRDDNQRFHRAILKIGMQPARQIIALVQSRLQRRAHTPRGSLKRIAEKNSFTPAALQVVVVRMKAWSWYLVIATVFAALTLSSCALSEEGVAPNPGELPDNQAYPN
jgi:hypothetical protein